MGDLKSTIDWYRAQALVMAEYEEAFEKPQYGFGAVKGSGFVRAGGMSIDIKTWTDGQVHLPDHLLGCQDLSIPQLALRGLRRAVPRPWDKAE